MSDAAAPSSAAPAPASQTQEPKEEPQKQPPAAQDAAGTKTPPGQRTPSKASRPTTPRGTATPRGTTGAAAAASSPTPGASPIAATPEKPAETEEEAAKRKADEARRLEEEQRLLRPWMSPAPKPILRKTSKFDADASTASAEGSSSAAAASEQPAAKSAAPVPETSGGGAAAAAASSSAGQHHIQFTQGGPVVYADFVFAAQQQRKLVVKEDGGVEAPVLLQQPQITDVCERLYAEAVAKKRLTEEREQAKARRISDEAGVPDGPAGAAVADKEDTVDPREYDPECTFHPVISEHAGRLKFKDWEQFMTYRDTKNQQAAKRWEQKKERHEKEAWEKAVGEAPKIAKMSVKLLAYKAKRGIPHRGPVSSYGYHLGKFILKRTSPEKIADDVSDGDSAERRRKSAEYSAHQRELTQRLYEDAVARVAARQVVERARVAADRAKLFQPMTNERLLAKLKELNPEHDADGLQEEMNVETRLLSQGEAYRLRKERRRSQHVMESTSECTFTPRTNPHSRQLLQRWARRVEVTGGDPSALPQSVMRVDRNLADSNDYAPLNGAAGARVFATEEEAMAALQAEHQRQQQQGNNNSHQSHSAARGGGVGAAKPRHIPDPEGYFERVKMQQLNRERQLAARRQQQQQQIEEGCTFRPSVAPLTVAICKIKDDKEFGPEDAARAHKEVLMPPHLRQPSAQWGERKGSPRKLPRGAQQSPSSSMFLNADGSYAVAAAGTGPASQQNSARRSLGSAHVAGSAARPSYHATPRTAAPVASGSRGYGASSASRLHADPATVDSEHFLADLEHELQGVISTWQSDGF